jgi:hypothetical protein
MKRYGPEEHALILRSEQHLATITVDYYLRKQFTIITIP